MRKRYLILIGEATCKLDGDRGQRRQGASHHPGDLEGHKASSKESQSAGSQATGAGGLWYGGVGAGLDGPEEQGIDVAVIVML